MFFSKKHIFHISGKIPSPKQNFSGKIIVRSSARGEDSLDTSQAGKFQTIFNIKPTEKNEIKVFYQTITEKKELV